jgi:protein-disulfide isomerase
VVAASRRQRPGKGEDTAVAQSGARKSGQGQGKGGKSSTSGRQSVAAARRSSPGNNRTQLIIGGIAIIVIIVVITIGVVLNRQQTATQAEGYGASTQSVATASADGVVTVSKPGSTPKATIDIYEDALCPACAELERQFGQQINQELDNGSLTVNYHMVDFLNRSSHSGDYSSRAAGALLCVAQDSGSQPGAYMAFHSALFASENQPAENGSTDLSNLQLADLAATAGANDQAQTCISTGANTQAAATAAAAFMTDLGTITGGRAGTPTVVHNGAPVTLNPDWLTNLVA